MKSPETTEFTHLRTDAERTAFHTRLSAPRWWLGGTRRSADFGWIHVFLKSDGKCVYCSRDLAASTDAIAEFTEEHLVPRSLLEANGVDFDNEHNLAVCCAGCNGLKADAVPRPDHPGWNSRKSFIKECGRFIAQRRLQNFQKYKSHVERVLMNRAGLTPRPVAPPKKVTAGARGPAAALPPQAPDPPVTCKPAEPSGLRDSSIPAMPPAAAIPPVPVAPHIRFHATGFTRPVNHSREWAPEDDEILRDGFTAGAPLSELAGKLQRGLGAIAFRLAKLFLITPEQQAAILQEYHHAPSP